MGCLLFFLSLVIFIFLRLRAVEGFELVSSASFNELATCKLCYL